MNLVLRVEYFGEKFFSVFFQRCCTSWLPEHSINHHKTSICNKTPRDGSNSSFWLFFDFGNVSNFSLKLIFFGKFGTLHKISTSNCQKGSKKFQKFQTCPKWQYKQNELWLASHEMLLHNVIAVVKTIVDVRIA